MKVLIVNMYYYPNLMGGAEHSVKLLAEGLAKRGVEVGVLTLDGSSKNAIEKEEINKVSIFRIYDQHIYKRRILHDKSHISDALINGLHSIINFSIRKYIRKVVADFMPDIIHTNNLVSMSYWIWDLAKKNNILVVHTLRDYWLLDPTTVINGSSRFVTVPFRNITRRISNNRSIFITAPSKRTIQLFQEFGYFRNSGSECVVNCIDFRKELLEKSIDEKLKRKNEDIVFLYAGKLSENKGLRNMLRAFKAADIEQATLKICGDGPLFKEINALAKEDDRIIVTGKISSKKLACEYQKADVLIVPSLWEEPFGRIVIEAAQYAVPTIGSDGGGIPETITSIKFGECYHRYNINELKDKIVRFSSRSYLKKMLSRGPQGLDKYSQSEQIEHFYRIYKMMIETEEKK